jgi:transcriptional regulator with XRE-family HTH domain
VDLAVVIRRRLEQLGIGQRELAEAAEVTESYISQLLSNKKLPPASDRTDIYAKLANILKVSSQELAKIADAQRQENLKRKVLKPPEPLFKEFRDLILRKCVSGRRQRITNIFNGEPFGEFERFITQKLLDAAKSAVREQLGDEKWIQRLAKTAKQGYEDTRVSILDFLDTDISHVSAENCISFLDPLIDSWDVDLETFAILIVLNRRLSRAHKKRLEFTETGTELSAEMEPGLKQFLADPKFSANVTEDELMFLKSLQFRGKRPTALYFYRELQNFRDPLNFVPAAAEKNRSPGKSYVDGKWRAKPRSSARTKAARQR